LNEHQDLLNAELNSSIDNSLQKLEQWRDVCDKNIDSIFKQKCDELEQHAAEKIDKQRKELNRVRSKVLELIHQQDATCHSIDLLTPTVCDLEEEIKKTSRYHLILKLDH
jgi:uncharacterized protein YicC (UPF0701 family)